YVRHYRAWNGQRAGALDDGACLDEYRASLAGWPDNALFYQRTIEALIRLGRLVEAQEALDAAYEQVPPHPRRDELLRARPARTAPAARRHDRRSPGLRAGADRARPGRARRALPRPGRGPRRSPAALVAGDLAPGAALPAERPGSDRAGSRDGACGLPARDQ